MQLHHDTDAIFHRQGWFLDLEHDLLDDLTAAGVPRGAALACAHVGVELLLDGELLRAEETAAAVVDVYGSMASPPAVALDVVAAPRSACSGPRTSTGIAERLDPFLYGDPSSVAQRLHRITSSRPRLAFEPEQSRPSPRSSRPCSPRSRRRRPTCSRGSRRQSDDSLGNTRPLK